MSGPVSEWFLTFPPVTAFALSCGVPTLLAGSETAAQVVPPSATAAHQRDAHGGAGNP